MGVKTTLTIIACCMFAGAAFPQNINFEEYKRKKEGEFDAFQKQRQEEFARFLEDSWKEYELYVGDKKPLLPEPISPRLAPPVTDKHSHTKISVITPDQSKPKTIVLPELKKPTPVVEKKYAPLRVNFFGHQLDMEFDKAFKSRLGGVQERNVGQYWSLMNNADHQSLIFYCRTVKDELNLNDWAYYQLVKSIARSLYQSNMPNEQVLFTAFVLSETGYDIRFGLVKNNLIIMLATNEVVYDTPFFRVENKKYYTPDMKDKERIKTYPEKGYDKGKKKISMTIERPIIFEDEVKAKTINPWVFGKDFKVDYNQHAIEFYNTIPPTSLEVYFNSQGSNMLQKSLFSELRKMIEGKSDREAVNALLRFTHYSFNYKTDKEQFGYERCFFYEELFAYPYSDCEDRSVLFAQLVRQLLSLPVVGLSYPGHVATAVKFKETFEGDYVEKDGSRYMVCDATFYGAVAGQSMPEFKNEKASLIEVR